MTATVASCAWPLSELNEAVELLARHTGQPSPLAGGAHVVAVPLTAAAGDRVALGRGLERLLVAHGLEVEWSVLLHHEAARLPAPAIVRLRQASDASDDPLFLVVAARQRGRFVTLLGRDRRWRRVDREACAAAIRAGAEAGHSSEVQSVLEIAAIRGSRRDTVARALLNEALRMRETADIWRVVIEPGGGFTWQLRRAGAMRRVAILLGLHAAQLALWIGS
ncbi:MAG: hypothetical protein ABIX28_23425, partial [Vicinamibacterales bacterium]